jgi:hypothetical protein
MHADIGHHAVLGKGSRACSDPLLCDTVTHKSPLLSLSMQYVGRKASRTLPSDASLKRAGTVQPMNRDSERIGHVSWRRRLTFCNLPSKPGILLVGKLDLEVFGAEV